MKARGRKRGGDPQLLADVVRSAYPSREPREAAAVRAFTWWRRAVPPRVYEQARPVRIAHGILYVHTATAAWAAELDHLRESLLESVQKHAPQASIRELRFRVGPLPQMPRSTRPAPKPKPITVPMAVMPEELARELARVDDDELRDAIRRAAGVSLSRSK